MRPKTQFHILSLVTLLVFPAIGLTLLWFFEDIELLSVFELDRFFSSFTLLGLEFGFIYGFLVVGVSQFPIFEELSKSQSNMLRNLKLNWVDILFMSFCAGFGEEVLFRAGLQTWLGPWLTSFLFIAVYGYFNPTSWRKSAIGILVFPFIIILSYAFEAFGLWFCIAAHFSYDLLMFMGVMKQSK